MAKIKNNILLRGVSGSVGKQVVYRDVKGKTVVSKHPNMNGVKLSWRQESGNALFREAVAYAQQLISDPLRKAELKKKLKANKRTRKMSAYNAAIQEYMIQNNRTISEVAADERVLQYRNAFPLSKRQALGLKFLVMEATLTNAIYKQINKISKATATRDLQEMNRQGIIFTAGKGPGAVYILLPLEGQKED